MSGPSGHDRLLPGEIGRPVPCPPRSRRVTEIVAASRRILEDEGPEALTMRRLGDELGIQAPSLYKHFAGKAAVEAELIADAMDELGEVTHKAIREPLDGSRLVSLLTAYRTHCRANSALYRLSTQGRLDRDHLPVGLEEWAGNPWYVVTGTPSLAQALWSFSHGMVILELDDRYPPGSDLDSTWRAGAAAFEQMAR
jgi:AcrR family transcriptional regulator